MRKFLYGMHDTTGNSASVFGERLSWVVFPEGIGKNPDDHYGRDYSKWADQGINVLARLNHSYGSGTIPEPQYYEDFATRCANFVTNSKGIKAVIIGNEMNHSQEWPQKGPILPSQYSICYMLCRNAIRALPGHENDLVAVGAVAPWNNQTAYIGNEIGDWIVYFTDMLGHIKSLQCDVDAIALHTNTHGSDPALITSEVKMNPPFGNRRFNFRAYQDFMDVIPDYLRGVPIYISETNQDDPWINVNQGWVQAAFKEINDWNLTGGTQQIQCLCLYRWPKYDKWYIEDKHEVHADFRAAMEHGYTINGNDDSNDNGGNGMPNDTNRLKNWSFEGDYPERGAGELKVAREWFPFWSDGLPPHEHSQGPCRRPEFKPLTLDVDPLRIYDGEKAQCLFVRYAVMDGGVYQKIEDLPVGAPFDFSVLAHAWCSKKDNPRVSDDEMYVSLGIDLDGGIDPWSLSVHWIQWVPLGATYKEIGIGGITRVPTVTVFVRFWNKWSDAKHADGYVDAAKFAIEEEDEPDPPPTGDGITEERAREIAREEAFQVILETFEAIPALLGG